MNKCNTCAQILPLSEFYKNTRRCKRCTCKKVAERTAILRALDPLWLSNERERCRQKSRRARSLGFRMEPSKQVKAKWSLANTDKRRAHCKVYRALKSGLLVKQPCAVCGSHEVEAHHPDYSRPLDVVWLCIPHHAEVHIKEREAKLRQRGGRP